MTTTTNRKPCPITLPQFAASAGPISASLSEGAGPADHTIQLEPKAFSTGSVGLWGQGKATIMLGGKPVPCQVGATLTAIGTKDAGQAERDAVLAGLKPTTLRLYLTGSGGPLAGTVKAPFSTGSFGWNVSGKSYAEGVTFQVSINVTVAGSKEAPRV